MAMCKHKRCCLFFLGTGLGAAAGVLLAPKSGSEIRRELFGGSAGAGAPEPGMEPAGGPGAEEDLKAKIEETRERLKSEIEGQQNDES